LAVVGVGVALFMGLPPPWWPDMPPGLVHSGVAIGVILILLGSVLVLHSAVAARQRHQMWPIVGMAFFGIGFLGCVAWYFWPSKIEAGAEKSPLDGEIQIASDPAQYPTVVPQNTFFELQLNNHFMMAGGAFLTSSQPAGSSLPLRDPSIFPSNGIRLRISNYGKLAIVNARVTFPIEFMAIQKIDNGIRSGEVIKSSTVTTNPFSIGPGEIVDIYAINYSTDAFAQVMIPQTAQGYAPGSDKEETFKLIPSTFAGMGMLPFVPKFPPVLSPPIPLPPDRPGKK
jgi:hypothetical protein